MGKAGCGGHVMRHCLGIVFQYYIDELSSHLGARWAIRPAYVDCFSVEFLGNRFPVLYRLHAVQGNPHFTFFVPGGFLILNFRVTPVVALEQSEAN